MGNPQEMTAFIYDWLEQLIDIIYFTITKIIQHKHVIPGIGVYVNKTTKVCDGPLRYSVISWW